MKKYFDYVINTEGQPVVGLSVAVVNAETGGTTIYSDDGITAADNPLTTDSQGYFEFYGANGRWNITISGSGFNTQTISDIFLYDSDDDTGILLESEVDADIKTFSLPASTTISAFGATLVDDADALAARTTLVNDHPVDEYTTDTTRNLVLADAWKTIQVTNVAANDVVIPANASIAFPVGTEIYIIQGGAGTTTVTISTDTLQKESGLTASLAGQWAVAGIKKTDTTEWVVFGNLAAAP